MVDVPDDRQIKMGLFNSHNDPPIKTRLQKYSLFMRVVFIGNVSLLIISMSEIRRFFQKKGKKRHYLTYGQDNPCPRMKTLEITWDEKKYRATVGCADGSVSVHRNCAFCVHCKGIRIGERLYPSPQESVLRSFSSGGSSDEALMSAAMQFNTLVKDARAIECDDDADSGFKSRYRR